MALTKNSQIDLNGNEMILDADADTKIDAATDDEIHFTVAGSETVYMGVTSYNASDRIVLTNTGGNASATIVGSTSGESSVFMADGTSGDASYRGYVQYQHTNDNMNFGTAGSEAMRITSAGRVGIGTTSPDVTFEIADTNAYMHIDATNHAAVFIDRASTSYHNNVFYQTADTTNWRLGQMGADDILQVRDEVNDNSNVMVWKHGGNVGIGTASPETKLEISGSVDNGLLQALQITNTDHANGETGQKVAINFKLSRGGTMRDAARITAGKDGDWNDASGADSHLAFDTTNNDQRTEKMRINSNGNVLLGDGATESITYTSANKLIMHHGHAFGNIGISLSCGAYTSSYELMRFYNGNGQVGDIMVSGSATDFDTSSDYRLKENVSYDWDATTRLKQLKPARFNWIADETNTPIDGFLAHEVSDIVPNAINGEKDAVYTAQDEANGLGKEGEPNMQSIDHSKLVPLLVKTIQELEARITTLEGE